MAATDVSICNSALLKLGANRINTLNDDTKAARLCQEQYPKLRDAALIAHPWNFAIKRVFPLSKLVTTPAFGYDNEFQLPVDCLRVLALDTDEFTGGSSQYHSSVGPHHHGYKIEGRKLLTDLTEVGILYIFQEINTGNYSPSFAEYLAWKMAEDLSYSLVQSNTTTERMRKSADLILRDVRSFDAQEGTPDEVVANTWINSRI